MSTYTIRQTAFSGQVIMNIHDVTKSDNTVLKYTQKNFSLKPDTTITQAISYNYPLLLLGDPENQKAYLYKISDTSVDLLVTFDAPDGSVSFGTSVSIRDNLLAISDPGYNNTGRVYVYLRIQGSWQTTPRHNIDPEGTNENFGNQIKLSDRYLISTSKNYTVDNGTVSAIYVFNYNYVIDVFTKETVVVSENSANTDFGFSFDFIGDNTLVVSSPSASVNSGSTLNGAGIIEIFRKNPQWNMISTISSPTPTTNGNFGVSLCGQQGRIVVGEPGNNSGFIHVFDNQGENWNIFSSLSLGSTDGFDSDPIPTSQGYAVSQHVSNRSLLWSSPNTEVGGTIYTAETTPKGNWKPSQTTMLESNDSNSGDKFGDRFYSDDQLVVVFAPGANSGKGEITFFEINEVAI